MTEENKVKAYKVFNPDWSPNHGDMKFEVGKSYELEGKIALCNNGFHASKNLADCFNYYDSSHENKIAEVLLEGDFDERGDKLCARKITIVREVTWEECLQMVNTGKANTGIRNSGYGNSGDGNSGDGNSGDRNSGDWNSGYRNSGYGNSGDGNSGYRNSGYGNSGDRNSGDGNSGDRNSGDGNSGDRNSGYGNSGDRNSGDWNSCDHSSGFFNSKESTVRLFNKESGLTYDDVQNRLPCFDYFELTEWVGFSNMTEEEKAEHPNAESTDGYLKMISYKDAWLNQWEEWGEDDRQKILNLPNFDAEVFEEITGIKVNE